VWVLLVQEALRSLPGVRGKGKIRLEASMHKAVEPRLPVVLILVGIRLCLLGESPQARGQC
jgi:hypothetical protein